MSIIFISFYKDIIINIKIVFTFYIAFVSTFFNIKEFNFYVSNIFKRLFVDKFHV